MNLGLSERRRHALTGAISVVLLVAVTALGIKFAFGAFDSGYELTGDFASAGQGLIPGSDVKLRGVNIGEVKAIDLADGQARIRVRIREGEQLPQTTQAVIRPKTLFGEKFVDILPGEADGKAPFLQDGDEIPETLGGFELEQVLADAFPIVEAIDPGELATVIRELADAGEGLGETINRSLVNGQILTDLQVENDAETRQFLSDLALLSDELGGRADDLIAGAEDLNVALPTINRRADEFRTLFEQLERLARDVSDLLDNNRDFVRNSIVEGGKGVQLLFDERDQLFPLVQALRRYNQTVAQSIRFEVGDGTLMAAVKGLLGVDACGGPCPGATGSAAATSEPASPVPERPDGDGGAALVVPDLPDLPGTDREAAEGADALIGIISRFGGGGHR